MLALQVRNSQSNSSITSSFLAEGGYSEKCAPVDILAFSQNYLSCILLDAHNELRMVYSFADYQRDIASVHRRIATQGLFFITSVLPSLASYLLDYLEGHNCTLPGFKMYKGSQIPCFMRRLFAIVMNECYSSETQARAFDAIYSVSVAFKKLRGLPEEKGQLDQYYDFVRTDKELAQINFEAEDLAEILKSAQTQWQIFAADISLDDPDCVPRPGPGATVGNVAKNLRFAPQVSFTNEKAMPTEDWFVSHPWDVVTHSREFSQALSSKVEPYSSYLLVPKTYTKWRGICKEMNEMQFRQQAIRRLLYAHIQKKLGRYIPIRDQSVHAEYALKASITRDDATIDESEASDRIARELVKLITCLTPEFSSVLMELSTRLIKPPKWANKRFMLQTEKFAPMGSAICFPVMSLVHLFLIRGIILTKHEPTTTDPLEPLRLSRKVSVYGDDIVLPSKCADLVYTWLPRFGMKINQTKSFVRSGFRESCGCHAYKGTNVTPIFIKYTFHTSADANPSQRLASLLANEETAFLKGWSETSRFLRKYIQAGTEIPLGFVSKSSPVVGFRRATTQLSSLPGRHRWKRDLQTFTYRVPCWSASSEKASIPSPEQAYLRWLCVGSKGEYSYRLDNPKINSCLCDPFTDRVDVDSLPLSIRWTELPHSNVC